MIIFIKKQNAVLIALIIFVATITASLALKTSSLSASKERDEFCVIIDAGHGEPDGGAVGTTGIKEQALNLSVSKKLEKILTENGISVIMTRADENGIYENEKSNISQKKVSDMHNREKIMNSSGADVFVSIHMNKFTDAKYSGPQVFFSANKKDESEKLALSIQQKMIDILKPSKEREIKKAENNIYLLKKAKIPAVLVECGFLSNKAEEELLITEEYQQKLAFSIYEGIKAYCADSANEGGKNIEEVQNTTP